MSVVMFADELADLELDKAYDECGEGNHKQECEWCSTVEDVFDCCSHDENERPSPYVESEVGV